MKITAEQRFFKRVDQSGTCWVWTGARRGNNRYGAFWDGKKLVAAHRFSYKIHFGEISGEMVVMHKCDTPTCVNPDHLSLGTQMENIHDAIDKGRLKRNKRFGISTIKNKNKYATGYRFKSGQKRKLCNRGHDITSPESVYVNPNRPSAGRICRLCKHIAQKLWAAKREEMEV